MLINDFFHIIKMNATEQEGCFQITIELNKNHDIFKGHFPETPVVPGVCIIQMVKEIATEILKKEVILKKADTIKYVSVINPKTNKIIHVDIQLKPQDEHSVLLNAKVYFEQYLFSKIKGILEMQ